MLTHKRRKWAEVRKQPPLFKGVPLRYPVHVQVKYANRLRDLVREMTAAVRREVLAAYRTHYGAQDGAADDMAALLVELGRRFRELFDKRAQPLAEAMADGATASSTTAMGASLEKLSGGMRINTTANSARIDELRKVAVQENVSLIKSVADEYLGKVEQSVMRSITTGAGVGELADTIGSLGDMTERRAELVALDQTRKVYNNVNKSRMQDIGIKKFEWIHSGGGAHPRELHQRYDGRVFRFDDLPIIDERTGERGIPGQAVNCRCTMTPVFDLDDEGQDDN